MFRTPAALVAGLHALQPRGRVVQPGLGDNMSIPMTLITSQELAIRSSFRFHEEFATGVMMMRKRAGECIVHDHAQIADDTGRQGG